jgi:ABC-type multidrug transport system fused ATPase/permease subunit
MKGLSQYIFRYKRQLFLGMIALIIVDVAQLWIPQIVREGVNRLGKGESIHDLAWLIAGLATGVAFFRFFWRYFLFGNMHRVVRDVRKELYNHLSTMSATFYGRKATGDLMAHATNDVEAVGRAAGIGVLIMGDAVLMIGVSLFYMITINPNLALCAFIPMPILAVFIFLFGKAIRARFKEIQEEFSNLTEKVRESISGVKVVKSFGQEESFERDFETANEAYVEKNLRLVRVFGVFEPVLHSFAAISMLIVLWVGGRATILGEMTSGDFFAFTMYLGMLVWPVMAIGWLINIIQSGRASMGRLNELFAIEPDIQDAPDAVSFPARASIEVSGLDFDYPGLEEGGPEIPALREISFSVASGSTLGIVGLTGSGKSSVVKLLTRQYEAPANTIRYQDADIRSIRQDDLHHAMAVVPQEPFLFSTTLEDNIRFARTDAGTEAVREAARMAGIDDEILAFPQGYQTVIGERGVTLSGGQKQRVSLARAILCDPQILILDDALSAVDAKKEEEILGNLRSVLEARTSVIISHRISAIRDADQILVFDDGRIVERGKHEDLVAGGGVYARLNRLQQAEEGLEH